jgi:hypothetical protein
MKKTLAVAAVALLAASLTACGDDGGDGDGSGSSGAGYCDQVEDLKTGFADVQDFTKITEDDFSGIQNALDDIESAAPDDVKDDWATLAGALDELKSILEEAGLTFDQLQQIQEDPTNLPEGVDLAKLQELGQKLSDFTDENDFQASADAIQAEVKDECGIDLDDDASTDPSSGS